MVRGVFAQASYKLEQWLRDGRRRSTGKRIEPRRLRSIVEQLLDKRNRDILRVHHIAEHGATRLLAEGRWIQRGVRHIVYIVASPPNGMVRPSVVEALIEDVARCGAASGMLLAPCQVDRSIDGELHDHIELVDGLALRELVARYLPHLNKEVARYRLTGTTGSTGNSLETALTTS